MIVVAALQDRNTNVARVGYVASVATAHRGLAICSLISPFSGGRLAARELVEATGAKAVMSRRARALTHSARGFDAIRRSVC